VALLETTLAHRRPRKRKKRENRRDCGNVVAVNQAVQTERLGFHVLTKPIGPICNLDCRYCFYLEKQKLYPQETQWRMSDAVLEEYIRQYIEEQPGPEIYFAWQGGEPTLLGVEFFEKVIRLQAKHAGSKKISNTLQTNGVLLDDHWGEFLAQYQFLVGLSIDGPRECHDRFRIDKGGKPTFDAVMRGLNVLKKHRVDFNTLTVVHRANASHPLEVYRFLKETGSGFIQFIPLVERTNTRPVENIGTLDARSTSSLANLGSARVSRAVFGVSPNNLRDVSPEATAIPQESTPGLDFAEPPEPGGSGCAPAPVTEESVEPEQYGLFLSTIFDEWVRRDVGRVFVQLFDVALGNWMGLGSSLCVFAEKCGAALAIEHNGDLYSCDHYVYPKYRLGNILNQSLGAMAASPAQTKFGDAKFDSLPAYCRRCEVRFACNGECPKHRFMRTPDGEEGLNYLCPAYKMFFNHINPCMRVMGQLLENGQAAADIMQMFDPASREAPKS
jgi:uncharacterized protein